MKAIGLVPHRVAPRHVVMEIASIHAAETSALSAHHLPAEETKAVHLAPTCVMALVLKVVLANPSSAALTMTAVESSVDLRSVGRKVSPPAAKVCVVPTRIAADLKLSVVPHRKDAAPPLKVDTLMATAVQKVVDSRTQSLALNHQIIHAEVRARPKKADVAPVPPNNRPPTPLASHETPIHLRLARRLRTCPASGQRPVPGEHSTQACRRDRQAC